MYSFDLGPDSKESGPRSRSQGAKKPAHPVDKKNHGAAGFRLFFSFPPSLFGLTSLEAASMMGEALKLGQANALIKSWDACQAKRCSRISVTFLGPVGVHFH